MFGELKEKIVELKIENLELKEEFGEWKIQNKNFKEEIMILKGELENETQRNAKLEEVVIYYRINL